MANETSEITTMRRAPRRLLASLDIEDILLEDALELERLRLSHLRVLIADLRCHLATKAGYDPNQPRDEAGRWANAGGSPDSAVDAVLRDFQGAQIGDAAYMGGFHDVVRDQLVDDLRAAGNIAETEVTLILPGEHPVAARIDILAVTKGGELRGIEIKTGEVPDFTPRQAIVYYHAVTSDVVVSPDQKIRRLGLTPGAPIERFKIDVLYARGPNSEFRIIPMDEYLNMKNIKSMEKFNRWDRIR